MGLDNNAVVSLLSMLDEPDDQLKAYALRELLNSVDSHWAIVSEALSKLENLAEDEKFGARETASALASKCFFHLEEYDDATRLALSAGKYFDVEGSSHYSRAIVGRCLETYVNLRGGQETGEEKKELDPRLEQVVERMFSNCYATKNFKRAIGMALEAKRLDKLREAIRLSKPRQRVILSYTLQNVSSQQSKFKQDVMNTLIELYSESSEDDVDYLEWFLCLHALQKVEDYASLLIKLICSTHRDRALVAFQAAFDLVEFQDQRFEKALDEALSSSPLLPATLSEDQTKSLATLKAILFEGKKAGLILDFMYKKNGSDLLLLKRFKDAAESGRKNSVLHHAMIVAHGYAQCGTTADAFLRENLEWLGRASNWAKFGATASLGVVHKGNVESAMMLLRPYLPATGGEAQQRSSPYSEGGALYALGLIHSAEGVSPAAKKRALDVLSSNLEAASTQEAEMMREPLMHGSCLGMGLVSVSSSDDTLIERMRNLIYADNAVVGESASLAMGLIMLGGGSKHASTIEDLLGYAHDTEHEKIVRGISLAAALAFYGQEDQADGLIEQLSRDKDHLIRYGGVFTVGTAYVGTGNNAAVRRLLHIAVSDVSNDVRRAAVICLGLVMLRLPEKLPGLIALLSESYNPHVRYGAAIALGIGCSSQADPKEALELLEPLLDDKTDFVRQGAMIGTAFLLAQVRPEVDSRAKRFREKIFAVVSDNKQASTMTRMGALLASGIVDMGGRNAFLSLIGRNGIAKPPAVAGFILWVQYWFWYPLMHMLSLSLSPSALIGVNGDLDLPKSFQVDCVGGDVAKRFGMPDPVEEKKEDVKSRVKTAVLSTTAKVSARQKMKQAAAPTSSTPEGSPTAAEAPSTAGEVEKKKVLPNDKDLLTNPIRVTKAMASQVRFRPGERYLPAFGDESHIGVVVLRDTTPSEAQDVAKVAVPPAGDVDPNEPSPPEPFEWTPPE